MLPSGLECKRMDSNGFFMLIVTGMEAGTWLIVKWIKLKGHDAPLPCSNNLSGEGLVQELLYEHLQGQRNAGITGIDPGRATTATISTRRIRSLFEDINRFEALQEDTDQIADIDTTLNQ
ncbi:hypothetical protein VTP01DRAFT_1443 [Rhizomucor pusillus]|uniref:uncharacterized protein n=1 Tax=Rhizomucor pusillus TaxID=4840 RepID=UPI0037423E1A